MRRIAATILALLLAWPAAGQSEADFSGIDRFWEIVDVLEADGYPTETQWTALLATPGYRYLVEIEGKEPLFRKHFPLAFMPSRRAERDSVLAGGGARYLRHYVEVAGRREELEAFRAQLQQADLMSDAVKLTEGYLPEGLVGEDDRTPLVAFAIFEPDGKANQDIVVVDLYFATLIDLVPFLAHEAHHYYKARVNRLNRPEPDHPDYPLVRSLAQLHTEGVADLIDKRSILERAMSGGDSDSWYEQNYARHVREAETTFETVDRLVREIAETPPAARANGEEIWSMLPFGAHPHGGTMAYAIETVLGRKTVVETLDNPMAFVRAYNRAAAASGGRYYVFSDEALEYFRRLEQKYVTGTAR